MKDNQEIRLFINSATKRLQVGVTVGSLSSTIEIPDPKKTLELTIIAIEQLLKRFDCKLKDVDSFYLLLGPGSNTGIRLGLTIPRTIYAFNPQIKLFGLPTLDLYQKVNKNMIPVLSDRNGNLFIKEGEETKRIDKDEVSTLGTGSSYIVEEADTAAIDELQDQSIIKIDVMNTMMRFAKEFHYYSSEEENYLPVYSQQI